jgi:hypothetical protein
MVLSFSFQQYLTMLGTVLVLVIANYLFRSGTEKINEKFGLKEQTMETKLAQMKEAAERKRAAEHPDSDSEDEDPNYPSPSSANPMEKINKRKFTQQ